MDKFDESIRNAKESYQPTNTFVEGTMKQISGLSTKKQKFFKLWLPAFAGGFAVVALLFVFVPALFGRGSSASTTTNETSSSSSQSSQSGQTSQGTQAAGTDNASLSSGLDGVNSAMNQETSDQTNADSALNDQSQQISVPTD